MEAHLNTSASAPEFFRVRRRRRELADTWTLELEPGRPFGFLPGQFNMLYVFGVGEVPISISGDPAKPEVLVHTVRAVGKTSEAICALRPGAMVGVRGPYGMSWPVSEAAGGDVVVAAGGIGLAPLRPAIYHLMAQRERYGRVFLFYGGRSPELLLYAAEVQRWRSRFDVEVEVTVDSAGSQWRGNLGVVTKLIARAGFEPSATTALVCGPEIMMRFAVAELVSRGVATERVYVSMERNMKCAIGLCGHCQYGPQFICKDGPVFPYAKIERQFKVREL
jgi:NAD(P)H-flavin reductase